MVMMRQRPDESCCCVVRFRMAFVLLPLYWVGMMTDEEDDDFRMDRIGTATEEEEDTVFRTTEDVDTDDGCISRICFNTTRNAALNAT